MRKQKLVTVKTISYFFSSYDNLPNDLKSQIKDDNKLEKQALYQVVTVGNTNTLVVTSKSNDALKKSWQTNRQPKLLKPTRNKY